MPSGRAAHRLTCVLLALATRRLPRDRVDRGRARSHPDRARWAPARGLCVRARQQAHRVLELLFINQRPLVDAELNRERFKNSSAILRAVSVPITI